MFSNYVFPSPHPYIFFNNDHMTMTFLGFNINRHTGDLIDPETHTVLERNIMKKDLWDALKRNFVDLNENFDDLPRFVFSLNYIDINALS